MDPEVAEELKALEAEVERARGDGPVAEGLARLELANLRILVKDYDGAEKDIAAVAALAFPAPRGDVERRKQALVRGLVSHHRGKSELGRGRIGPAESHYEAALPLVRESGDLAALASVLLGLGMANSEFGKFADALMQWEEAEDLFVAAKDPAGDVAARALLDQAYEQVAQTEELLDELADEADRLEKEGEGVRLGRNLRIQGAAHVLLEEEETACELFEEAIDEFDAAKHPIGAARARRGLAFALVRLGEPEDAADCLEAAAADYAALGNTIQQARVLLELAEAHEAAHRGEDAMKSYAAAADLFEKEESAFESGLALERQGDLAAEGGDWPLARAKYELALGRYGEDVDDYTAGCLLSLARAHEALGDRDRAKTCFEGALKAYRGMEDERSAKVCEGELERIAKGKKSRS